MIPRFIQRIFTLRYDYDTILEQQRAQRLLYILGVVMFITGLWAIFLTIPSMLDGTGTLLDNIIPPIVLVASLLLYNLIQRGNMQATSQIFVALIFLISAPLAVEDVISPTLTNIMLPIVLAGVLLSRRELLIVVTLSILLIARGTFFAPDAVNLNIGQMVAIILVVSLSGLFLALFNSSLENITRAAGDLILMTRRLGQRDHDYDEEISSETIVTNAINHLRNQLGYSYVRFVMLDDDEQPGLVYYSSIGVEQVAQTTNFSFTSNSAFQQALNSREPQLISQRDPGNISAHLLPSSNTGVIIPARSFNQLVALVDIQTESEDPIESEVVNILDVYISQIAGSLVYQRMVSALRSDILEQQNIISQQRTQIDTLQVNQSEGIVSDWQYYLQQRGMDAIGYDIDEKRQVSDLYAGDIPEDLRPAFEDNEIIIQPAGDNQNVVIPIQFRETVVGAISFQIPAEIPITERKLDFIRSVTERLALALDNKRLLEQTQIQAQRESTANEIGSVLLSSTDVQSVLQTAVSRFNEALGAVSTRIYLQPSAIQPVDRQQREDTV